MIARTLCVVLLSLCMACSKADDSDRLSRELVELFDMPGHIARSMETAMQHPSLTLDPAAIEQVIQEVYALPEWAQAQQAEADLYAELFTDEELRALLTFFKTPAGRTYLENAPTMWGRRAIIYAKLAEVISEMQPGRETTEDEQ